MSQLPPLIAVNAPQTIVKTRIHLFSCKDFNAIAMIEVLKTDVNNKATAHRLVELIHYQFPDHRVNFDLHDCDRILRIQSTEPRWEDIIELLQKEGHQAALLEDEIKVSKDTSLFLTLPFL